MREAAYVVYEMDDPEYDWIDTVRYMGLFHEVEPAENALRCLDCHRPEGRMDWNALGYDNDPMEATLNR